MNGKSIFWFLVAVICSLISGREGCAQERQWHEAEGYRWADLAVPREGKTGFTQLSAAETGLIFTNTLAESSLATNRVLGNGSGVAVGDFDNDGLPDIYFCALQGTNTLYRNLGHWRFKDVTAEVGLAGRQTPSRAAVFADLNGDGYLDLLVSTVNEGVRCFMNDGRGKFVEGTDQSGTRSSFGSMTMALADVDGNGSLDLYIANYRPDDIRDKGRLTLPAVKGKPIIPPQYKDRLLFRNGQLFERGQLDQLLLNDGKGIFHPVSWTDGAFLDEAGKKLTEPPLDWGLTATFRDVNGDGFPDLYVCNDYWTPDRFWINDGHGHFRAIDKLALRKTSSSSMGVDFADLDRDGRPDFFVVDMLSGDSRLRRRQRPAEMPAASIVGSIDDRPQVMRNTLFHNQGDGTFAEIADFAGVAASDWSWAPIFMDVDLDGYEDLLVSAGHFRDVQDMDAERQIQARQHSWNSYPDEGARQKAFTEELMEHYRLYPPLNMPIKTFRNQGGFKFQEMTAAWGTGELGVHHGIGMGDFDQDGDLDFVVNNLNGPAGIYRNETVSPRVAVRLKGLDPNAQGIGAKVTCIDGAIPRQSSEVISGGRYLSGSEPLLVFAVGESKKEMTLEVNWRSGKTSVVHGVRSNRIYEVDEKSGQQAQPPVTRSEPALFKEVSGAISHEDFETSYNDFERQPLLLFKLSQAGPGIAWFDLNDDGHDDLIIGSGSGGKPKAFLSDGHGNFSSVESDASTALSDDMSGLIGWTDPGGKNLVITSKTGYESAQTNAAFVLQLREGRLAAGDLPALETKTGSAIALGAGDRPGSMVLFVSGGVAPGRYPNGSPSKLYRLQGGSWRLDTRNSALFENIGIVNGAVWSDLTGDGIPELLLACEWGPIRIFQFRNGLLFDATEEFGLSNYTGWWKGITTGDVDGDGKMDIIAANWGLNSPYHASPESPLTFYYGSLARPDVLDIVETERDSTSGKLAPTRRLMELAGSLPFLLETFGNFKQYSEASITEVLGERSVLARHIEVNTLASMVFLNRGSHFEVAELPREAQMSPAFSVNVADLDGDGNEDIFLSQNFFATRPELPRLDAGRGLLLRGDGRGHFTAMPGDESGIKVYGEQRGAALCDFDEDGRVDLVVAQNGARTVLYQNVNAATGLRIKLKGPPTNPHGIGSMIRLQSGNRLSPAREVHGGSGYWSQDSYTQIIAMPPLPATLQVRWPGGATTSTSIPAGTTEARVDAQGALIK